ncbi:MAG: cupin domain-containing protein [Hyphomonadaceae bacterium]|nr:cupin domain-containing protein [Hyphomonadaceae bacterium]
MIVKPREDYRAFRISPQDTNKMVLLFDPAGDEANFVCVVEIFDVGGRTPPNKHEVGQEMFYVLKGEGRAHSDGRSFDIRAGDSMLVPPGCWHEVENTGAGKLYCLTMMTPNDGFAELIRAGEPAAIDEEDWAVIQATGRAA